MYLLEGLDSVHCAVNANNSFTFLNVGKMY